jgi:co-chaperonin GroES (HSP10)
MLADLAEFKEFHPMGMNVLVAKDQDEAQSSGGVIIPERHREYRRRGWVIVAGDGQRKGGKIVPPPYKPGDYIYADRHYARPDESEDEVAITDDGVAVIITYRDIWGFVSPARKGEPTYGVEYKAPPAWVQDAIEHFSRGAAACPKATKTSS